ncbi:MAG: ABC transporter ATP-binding protein [Sphingobacteriales bacterium]|nr:ABC transporter ATP-binding protein [Sphingobacteriales bacterium]
MSTTIQPINLQDQQFHGRKALWPFLKRIFGYTLLQKNWLVKFVIAVIAVSIGDALMPVIWKHFLDDAIIPVVDAYQKQQQYPDFTPILIYTGLFLANGVLQITAVFYFIKFAGYMEETTMFTLRKQMFSRLQQLSYSFYDKSATGWLLSRISSDAPRVTELISWGFLEVIWGLTMLILCMAAMFFYNWKLALIIAFSLPLAIALSVRLRMLILKYSRAARKINSELTAAYNEHVNGVEVNKTTTQEARVSNEFKGLSNQMRRNTFRASFYSAMYAPLVIFIGSVGTAIVLYWAGYMGAQKPAQISIGTLSAFFSYITFISWAVLDIARFYAQAQGSLSAGERIFSLIDEQPDIVNRTNASDFGQITGDIIFENVRFQYNPEKVILPKFNLHIPAGQSLALRGKPARKTTIANLVGRFYEPSEGRILIDGQDYMDKTLESLRRQMGIVLQTPHLFPGTIRTNICYGKINASDTEILQALEMAGASQFATRLDEEVGEDGGNLSQGEAQLLSFARALLVNPRILIMDEATSSIDTLTEAKIQQGINALIHNRTAIIIAHRLSTIKNCDRILVLSHGEIIEDGNHQTLMDLQGHYYQLYTKHLAHGAISSQSFMTSNIDENKF